MPLYNKLSFKVAALMLAALFKRISAFAGYLVGTIIVRAKANTLISKIGTSSRHDLLFLAAFQAANHKSGFHTATAFCSYS